MIWQTCHTKRGKKNLILLYYVNFIGDERDWNRHVLSYKKIGQ